MMFYTEQTLDAGADSNGINNVYINNNNNSCDALTSLNEEKFQSRRNAMRSYSSSGDRSYQIEDIFYKEQLNQPPLLSSNTEGSHETDTDSSSSSSTTSSQYINGYSEPEEGREITDQLGSVCLQNKENGDQGNSFDGGSGRNKVGPPCDKETIPSSSNFHSTDEKREPLQKVKVARRQSKGLVNAQDPKRVSFQEESEWLEHLVQNEIEAQRLKKLNPERSADHVRASVHQKCAHNGQIILRGDFVPYVPSKSDGVEEVPIKFTESKEWLEVLGQRHVNSPETSRKEKDKQQQLQDDLPPERGTAYLLPSEITTQGRNLRNGVVSNTPPTTEKNSPVTLKKTIFENGKQQQENRAPNTFLGVGKHGSPSILKKVNLGEKRQQESPAAMQPKNKIDVTNNQYPEGSPSVKRQVSLIERQKTSQQTPTDNISETPANVTKEGVDDEKILTNGDQEDEAHPKMKDALKIFQVIEGSRKLNEQFQ